MIFKTLRFTQLSFEKELCLSILFLAYSLVMEAFTILNTEGTLNGKIMTIVFSLNLV